MHVPGQYHTTPFMSRDQLMKAAPTLFAERPAEHISARYKFASTSLVLDELAEAGWGAVKVMAKRANKEENIGFEKHVVRMRKLDQQPVLQGEILPELILTNSHNGDTAFRFDAGIYRLVCSNGLTVASASVASARLIHTKYDSGAAIEAASTVAATFDNAIDLVERMRNRKIGHLEAVEFARESMLVRYGERDCDEEGNERAHWPFEPERLFRLQRRSDDTTTLWNTFNVVQENLVRGGIRGINAAGDRTTSRGIKSVQTLMDVNTRLWTLAENALNN